MNHDISCWNTVAIYFSLYVLLVKYNSEEILMKLPIFSIGHVNSELFSLAGGIRNHEESATGDDQNLSEVQSGMLNYVNALCINSWQVHVSLFSSFSWHSACHLLFSEEILGFLPLFSTSLIIFQLFFMLHHMIIC